MNTPKDFVGRIEIGLELLGSHRSPDLNSADTLLHFRSEGKLPKSKERLNKRVKLSAMTEAESLSKRALIRSKPIALLVFSRKSCFKVNCTSKGLSLNLLILL